MPTLKSKQLCINNSRRAADCTDTRSARADDSALGVGRVPAIIALSAYILLPILNNTIIGVKNIDPNVKEAAKSMGMTRMQLIWNVELPIAIPLILSGIRLSSVYVISWATLASYIGAGGLGDFVFNGLNSYQPELIISAAVMVTLLALIADFILSLQKMVQKEKKYPDKEYHETNEKLLALLVSLTVLSGQLAWPSEFRRRYSYINDDNRI